MHVCHKSSSFQNTLTWQAQNSGNVKILNSVDRTKCESIIHLKKSLAIWPAELFSFYKYHVYLFEVKYNIFSVFKNNCNKRSAYRFPFCQCFKP